MLEFRDLHGAREFETACLPYLLASMRKFFGCEVEYSSAPIKLLREEQGLDVAAMPRRGVYISGPDAAIVLGRVLEERDTRAVFALKLTHARLKGQERILNNFEGALAAALSRAQHFRFRPDPQRFGEQLIEAAIANFFSKGHYDPRRFLFLMDVFRKLAALTFEGRDITTGLILTQSHYDYAKEGERRAGTLIPLRQSVHLSPGGGVDKRFWYLVDGRESFFVCDRRHTINNMFVLSRTDRMPSFFVDDYALSRTLKGGDALFRVTSRSEYSITSPGAVEFDYKDNAWRLRDLNQIAGAIRGALPVDQCFVQSLLYYVFLLSRRRLSSLLWVPREAARVDEVLLSNNRLTRGNLSIIGEAHTETLVRMLSSDGASVISTTGDVIAFGCIVDISKVQIEGISGTGELVSRLLATNGIAVKVSQDGAIQLYLGAADRPLVI